MNKFSSITENDHIKVNNIKLNSELIFITENDKQIGSLILCTNENKASIFSVSILEKWRGKGYSKKLVQSAIDLSKSKGIKIIELSTELDNDVANNLYKKLGFELTGIKDDYNNYRLIL